MSDKPPVCPECGGPMHLESTAYGRAWECDRRRGVSWCPGAIQIAEDEVLSELQIADAIARCTLSGSKDHQREHARYRRVSGPLGRIAKSRYLSAPERRVLEETRAIVERLANAAELAKNKTKRQEKTKEADRQERLRKALGLLGPILAPDPTRLEASAIDLLALARFAEKDCLLAWDSIEELEARLRHRAMGGKTLVDALFVDLISAHQTLREDLAHGWSLRPEPVEDLHARFTEALPGLREAILASPPVYLQVVRRLLAESESDNVVRLAPRRAS